MSRPRPLPDTWRGRLAQQIRAFRKERAGISSPIALAKAAKVGKQAIEHLETASGNPTAETLDAVLAALKADLQIAVVPRDESPLDKPTQLGVKHVPSSSQEREKPEGASMNDDPDPRRDQRRDTILKAYDYLHVSVQGDPTVLDDLVRTVQIAAGQAIDAHLKRRTEAVKK